MNTKPSGTASRQAVGQGAGPSSWPPSPSSAQASLEGRYAGSEYGKSKLAGENLFRSYSERTGAPVLIYRFPNLYGKWCRPRYNSAVATFCDAIANSRPYEVSDPTVELELLYTDDLVTLMWANEAFDPERPDTYFEDV